MRLQEHMRSMFLVSDVMTQPSQEIFVQTMCSARKTKTWKCSVSKLQCMARATKYKNQHRDDNQVQTQRSNG